MLSLTFGVWPVLSIAGLSLLRPSFAVSWLAGFWALAQLFWLGLTFAIYLNLLSLPLRRSFVRLLIQGSSAICMSEASSNDDVVELTLRLRGQDHCSRSCSTCNRSGCAHSSTVGFTFHCWLGLLRACCIHCCLLCCFDCPYWTSSAGDS